MVQLSEGRLDQLRQAVINCLNERDIEVQPQDLYEKMAQIGFETELRSILSEKTYTHAAFARKTAEMQDVYDGWCRALAAYRA